MTPRRPHPDRETSAPRTPELRGLVARDSRRFPLLRLWQPGACWGAPQVEFRPVLQVLAVLLDDGVDGVYAALAGGEGIENAAVRATPMWDAPRRHGAAPSHPGR